MMSIIEQTRDEKLAMYMKLTKRELAEMLANRDEFLAPIGIKTDVRWDGLQTPAWST